MKKISSGVVHKVPQDLKVTISSSEKFLTAWNTLTPLARNEWICWITSVKKAETRVEHIERAHQKIVTGTKRPCCWPGCPHRKK